MANIGFLNPADNGGYIGKIDTLAFSNTIGLRRFVSDNPKAPKFEVMALTNARTWIKIGAVFEQVIRSSGEVFYQGRIDDPSMSRPMDIALFGDGKGGFAVAWTRRRAPFFRTRTSCVRSGSRCRSPWRCGTGCARRGSLYLRIS